MMNSPEARTIAVHEKLGPLAVNAGISQAQIDELIRYANSDEQVRRFSSDAKRFRDKEAFEKWWEKGRSVYTMSDGSGKLLGIIWYGAEALPTTQYTERVDHPEHYGITFAIRLYEDVRGQRLARKFMEAAQAAFTTSPSYEAIPAKGIWLETFAENAAAVNAYKGFGYRQIAGPDDHGRILMILPDQENVAEQA